jgi:hypothetical protein
MAICFTEGNGHRCEIFMKVECSSRKNGGKRLNKAVEELGTWG